MPERFAFTAQYWGGCGAVICRAIEDRPGPVVEQQFGEFNTWTQAHNFASKLNEGLDLAPHEVRQVVTSSFLATARVIHEALNSNNLWIGSSVERHAREAQLRFVILELEFAMTLCRTVSLLSESASLCTFNRAKRALRHTQRFLMSFDGNYGELQEILQHAEALQKALQPPPPALRHG